MVSVCLPSDALCNTYHLTWVSLTLDKGYLLTAAPPDLELGVAPLGPPAPAQPPLLGRGVAPLSRCPWPRTWSSSSWPPLCAFTAARAHKNSYLVSVWVSHAYTGEIEYLVLYWLATYISSLNLFYLSILIGKTFWEEYYNCSGKKLPQIWEQAKVIPESPFFGIWMLPRGSSRDDQIL